MKKNTKVELTPQKIFVNSFEKITNHIEAEGAIPEGINWKRIKTNALLYIKSTENVWKIISGSQSEAVKAANLLYNFSILGLDMGQDHAHLIPYGGSLKPIITFKGKRDLILKYGSPKVIDILEPVIVYENDKIKNWGKPNFEHIISDKGPFVPLKERGEKVGIYVTYIAKVDNTNVVKNCYMLAEEIEKVKASSKASKGENSVWKNWEEEMWKKTIIHRLYKQINLVFKTSEQFGKIDKILDQEFEPINNEVEEASKISTEDVVDFVNENPEKAISFEKEHGKSIVEATEEEFEEFKKIVNNSENNNG